MAEFAIVLPILLLVLFGLIEFARMFQAWVVLQNSARTAVRLAITGQYFDDRYNLDDIVGCEQDPPGAPGTNRGTFQTAVAPSDPQYRIDYYTGGSESLFATWYDGLDCDPGNENHLQMRRDILRIVSIYEEARRGAAGLAIERTQVATNAVSVANYLYQIWNEPMPRSNQRSWFDVTICSSRPRMEELSGRLDPDIDGRFITITDLADVPAAPPDAWPYRTPFCMMNEIPTTESLAVGGLDHSGFRWLDAGGPGDRVTVIVTFNHPLITPLPFQDYIVMQAQRSAVNESFRASRAVGSIQGSQISAPTIDTPTPLPSPTNVTATFTPLPSATFTPTATATATQPNAFDCDLLQVRNVTFNQNRFFMEFVNDNYQSTTLMSAWIDWPDDPAHPVNQDYPNMYLSAMALNTEVHWVGNEPSPPVSTVTDGTFIPDADREVPGESVRAWNGVFVGPPVLGAYMSEADFAGTSFVFDNPVAGQPDCTVSLTILPTPVPTDPPPDFESPTPTFTPDCASQNLTVEFVSFDTFGDVRLRVRNNFGAIAPFTGMSIVWPSNPGLVLQKVVVGGSNADDIPQINPSGTGVMVWQGPDNAPNTVSPGGDGTWITDFNFPPFSSTFLHLDFSGTGAATLPGAFGIGAHHFNGTNFTIGCVVPGGGSATASGGGASGTIFLANNPTPAPTNPPVPTNTPGPTLTPSITNTPRPPTFTWTPRPTNTAAPPTNTPVIPPTPTATLPGVGGVGGSD